jgi:hypothetical protein
MALELTDDQVHAWVVRSRAACGLGPKITDWVALRRIITLAFTGLPEQSERPDRQPDQQTDGGRVAGSMDGEDHARPA